MKNLKNHPSPTPVWDVIAAVAFFALIVLTAFAF